jgi:hypothetical protein
MRVISEIAVLKRTGHQSRLAPQGTPAKRCPNDDGSESEPLASACPVLETCCGRARRADERQGVKRTRLSTRVPDEGFAGAGQSPETGHGMQTPRVAEQEVAGETRADRRR